MYVVPLSTKNKKLKSEAPFCWIFALNWNILKCWGNIQVVTSVMIHKMIPQKSFLL